MSAEQIQPQTTGDTLPPGTPLLSGQFLIEGFLNSGGFGITYIARDSLERRVVLKECFPSQMCCRVGGMVKARSHTHQNEFEAVVRLFGQEARRLSKLDHPNIVGVRDVFEENGTAYMALDHIEGRDLHDIIEQETWRLDPETVRDITLKLLDAIGHVHAKGMLHRDISPDNILLTNEGEPILIDFGAARDTARRKSRILSTLHVVKDGFSPQEFYLQAGEQSPASDLYSLAASLYCAITGDPPIFSHRRLAAIAERQPDPYVPLAGNAEGFDRPFLTMIDQALAVFARDRVQSATEWLSGIAGLAPGRGSAFDEAEIVERIRALVEATNPEVKALHERRAKERSERARKAAEEMKARELAQRKRLEAARREAEEAERDYRERLAAEEAQRKAAQADQASEEGAEASESAEAADADAVCSIQDAEVPHAAGAGGVNRAKLLAEREQRARAEREEAAADAKAKKAKSRARSKATAEALERPESRGSLLGLVLGGSWRRTSASQDSKEEGYGA